MRNGPGDMVRGLVAQRGLSAGECRLLRANTGAHERLNVRMRRADVQHEQSNYHDGEGNASRVYEVLVSTGNSKTRLAVRSGKSFDVLLLTLLSGRRGLVPVLFVVRRVRAVVVGLRSSEVIHRALLEIAAVSD